MSVSNVARIDVKFKEEVVTQKRLNAQKYTVGLIFVVTLEVVDLVCPFPPFIPNG